ncbi:hypothetical protein [Bradyrhizobium sp. RDM4]|uniref:hypothetical protein n=1 Tax=Bradyrhizobium sp. RDM4 TaxID=3378765 RepID=UPI0038FC6CA1
MTPFFFDRSANLLECVATRATDERTTKETSETFASLFTIQLSGTHASVEQRLRLIERLLLSGDPRQCSLGVAALDKVLQTEHFTSSQSDFGARRRDFGYRPRSGQDVAHWFDRALELIKRLAFANEVLKVELRKLLARHFRGLWTSANMYDELERLCRKFAADGFWRDGWVACRETIHFQKSKLTSESSSRLISLEANLKPANLTERVQAVVLGDRLGRIDLIDLDGINADGNVLSEFDRLDVIARELGALVATDDAVFAKLLPALLRGGNRAWAFGRGLAAASRDRRATWGRLVDGLEQLPPDERSDQIMRGYLAELRTEDPELAQSILDTVLEHPASAGFLPMLQSAVGIDARGVYRLKQGLRTGKAPIWTYEYLALGRATDDVAANDLRDLLLLIAVQPNGLDVAVQVLDMRLHSDRSAQRMHEPDLLEAGRKILLLLKFKKDRQRDDHNLANVVRACLAGIEDGPIAAEVTRRLMQAVMEDATYAFNNNYLLGALLSVQPEAVLDALFERGEQNQRARNTLFDYSHDHQSNPADEIRCENVIAWSDRDQAVRYALTATIVTFARRDETTGTLLWSKEAVALLANAPDPKTVLAVFVERFKPMSWSGSRAALIEANATLLDCLDPEIAASMTGFITEAKERLASDVAAERQYETARDQVRDERFE